MHKTNSNICIIGVVLFIICLFFSCEMKKTSGYVVTAKASDTIVIDLTKEPVVMDMDMVRFGPSVNCACGTNIRY